MTAMSDTQLWWIALGAGAAVVLVVWALLALIAGSADRIRDTVADIWVAGPAIANNTVHVDVLRYINQTAGQILESADRIAGSAARIHEHANGCPGCPRCVVGWSGGGPAGIGES